MAPNSPESPGKKRKQPINGRDRPLFATRRPTRSLQQPPEFLTDSLNTSYIPSPSPPKSPTREAVRAKPRQALGNGPSLAAKATPQLNDENKPPSSHPSLDRRRSQPSPSKPRPVQSVSGAKSKSPSKSAQRPTRAKTPSPQRGRQNSITSPANSESSPPRGYAEAYQRIVEEEILAQEDSIEDMEEMDGYDYNGQDRSQDVNRMRLQRIQHSVSPISLKASRRASPRGAVVEPALAEDAIDEKENIAHDSDNESVSNMENATETSMGSESSQYAKDLQRLNGVLKGGGQAFSKARLGEKVGLTMDNLRRRNGSNESLRSAFSAESLSNRSSDPSTNVPKAWGRKAKPGKDWLSRINSRSGKLTGDVPKRHSSGDQMIADNQEREWSEPIDEWVSAAADVPLPYGEEGGLSQTGRSSRGSTPTTTVQRNTSLDRKLQWEVNDDEFTGRFLQVSESPPIRIRNAALDRTRDLEIESLEKRAVTTSRLGELREKTSEDRLRRSSSKLSTEELQHNEEGDIHESPRNRRSSGKSIPRAKVQYTDENNTPDITLEDAGEPIPDTPVVIYRSKSEELEPLDDTSGQRSEQRRRASPRPSHERKDSHDLLKRLARATSESPSPTKAQIEPEQQSSEPKIEAPMEQTPQTSRSTSKLKTPIITGGWIDQTISDKTPQASMPNVSLKTPLVTGAWIDTPLPTGGRGPPMPTPSDLEEQKELSSGKLGATDLIRRLSPNTISTRPKLSSQAPLKYSGPPLPKSALEEIINGAKSSKGDNPPKASSSSDSEEDPTLYLGESTIQSLEELIANDEDFSTLLAPTPPSPETSPPNLEPSPSSQKPTITTTTAAKSSRLSDFQSYTHILSRLTNLAPSIRASKKQIASLERAVSTSSTTPAAQRELAVQQEQGECNEAGEFHDFIWPCQRCGCPGRMEPELAPLLNLRDSITSITIPIPRLWRWRREDWRPRLTWLGVLTFVAWGLVLGEIWARYVLYPLITLSNSSK